MRHLFPHRAVHLRLTMGVQDGLSSMSWTPVTPGKVWCRLEFGAVRSPQDAALLQSRMAPGTAPERTGVIFALPPRSGEAEFKDQDVLRIEAGPVKGNYLIMGEPDPATGYSELHHWEMLFRQVAQLSTVVPTNAGESDT